MKSDNFYHDPDAEQHKVHSFAFIIVVFVCVLLSITFLLNSVSGNLCKIELESRINPNSATPGSLVRLPGIGFVRASAIVSYRENFNRQENMAPAFKNCDDLQKVKGIGPKTVQNICKWLKFE